MVSRVPAAELQPGDRCVVGGSERVVWFTTGEGGWTTAVTTGGGSLHFAPGRRVTVRRRRRRAPGGFVSGRRQRAEPAPRVRCECGASWTGEDTCHCACHWTFADVAAFDAHRIGGCCLPPGPLGLVRVRGRWTL